MNLNISIANKKVKPVYGGSDVIITYDVIHSKDGTENNYVIEARVRFTESFGTEIEFLQVVGSPSVEEQNENTLTDEAILELCEEERG